MTITDATIRVSDLTHYHQYSLTDSLGDLEDWMNSITTTDFRYGDYWFTDNQDDTLTLTYGFEASTFTVHDGDYILQSPPTHANGSSPPQVMDSHDFEIRIGIP